MSIQSAQCTRLNLVSMINKTYISISLPIGESIRELAVIILHSTINKNQNV